MSFQMKLCEGEQSNACELVQVTRAADFILLTWLTILPVRQLFSRMIQVSALGPAPVQLRLWPQHLPACTCSLRQQGV